MYKIPVLHCVCCDARANPTMTIGQEVIYNCPECGQSMKWKMITRRSSTLIIEKVGGRPEAWSCRCPCCGRLYSSADIKQGRSGRDVMMCTQCNVNTIVFEDDPQHLTLEVLYNREKKKKTTDGAEACGYVIAAHPTED